MKHESKEANKFWINQTTRERVVLAKQLKIKMNPYSSYMQLPVKARAAIEKFLNIKS